MVADNKNPCVRNQVVMDVQWSDCPEDIATLVAEKIWSSFELGNDVYIFKYRPDSSDSLYGLTEKEKQTLDTYLKSEMKKHNLESESVWIHWWW